MDFWLTFDCLTVVVGFEKKSFPHSVGLQPALNIYSFKCWWLSYRAELPVKEVPRVNKLHFFIVNTGFICSVFLPLCRGSTSSRSGPSDPLPGRRVSLRHHCDRLPDEAHLDDHDGRLQVRQNQEAHHLPQPQLHGPAAGVRGGSEQRNNPANPHAKADRRGDGRLVKFFSRVFAHTLTVLQETRARER